MKESFVSLKIFDDAIYKVYLYEDRRLRENTINEMSQNEKLMLKEHLQKICEPILFYRLLLSLFFYLFDFLYLYAVYCSTL